MISKRDSWNNQIGIPTYLVEWVALFQPIHLFYLFYSLSWVAFCIPCSAQSQTITLIKEFSFNQQLAPNNVFTPDGNYFVTQQPNYVGLYLRNLETGEVLQTYEDKDNVYRHAFTTDGRLIAFCMGTRIVVKDVQSGTFLKEYDLQHVLSICYSHDGTSFLAGEAANNGIIRVNSQTGEIIQTYPLTDSFAFLLAFSPDESQILCFTGKRGIIIDAKTGEYLNTFAEENGIYAGSFLPDFSQIGILGSDYKVRVWQTNPKDARFAPIQKVWTLDEGVKYHFPAISLNQKYMIVGNWKTNTAAVWDIAAGKIVQSLEHSAPVSHNMFSPDGSKVITYCDIDKTIRIWDARKLMLSSVREWKEK